MTVMIKPTVKYYSNQGVSKSTFPLTKEEQPSILHRNALLCSLHLCGEGIMLQQDNELKHTSNLSRRAWRLNPAMDFPPQWPEINSTHEGIWKLRKTNILGIWFCTNLLNPWLLMCPWHKCGVTERKRWCACWVTCGFGKTLWIDETGRDLLNLKNNLAADKEKTWVIAAAAADKNPERAETKIFCD